MLKKSDYIYKIFEKEMKKISRKKKVVDIGTSKRFAKEMEYFRHFFSKNYQAVGYKPKMIYGKDNCDLSGDILNLPFKNRSIDAVICLEVIEHVVDPMKAITEIYRVIKPKGTVILTTPFLLPFHGKGKSVKSFSHSSYPDFWRFTHQGLEFLFKDFSEIRVIPFTSTLEHYLERFFQLINFSFFYQRLIKKFVNKLPRKLGCATHRHLVIASK